MRERTRLSALFVLALVALSSLVGWGVFEWSGEFGGPARLWVEGPAPELAQDVERVETAALTSERDAVQSAELEEQGVAEPVEAASVASCRLDLEVRVPSQVLHSFRREERPAPAWLRVEPPPGGMPFRLVGERGRRGWSWDLDLEYAPGAHLELELPGGARLVRDVPLEPGRNRLVIDLAEESGSTVALALRFDESVLEWVDERADREEPTLDDGDPAGWIELTLPGDERAVAWAPLQSTKFAASSDDDLDLATAVMLLVPPGTYEARLRGAVGPFVRPAAVQPLVVGDADLDATLTLELVENFAERTAGIEFELIGLGALPATVDVVTYGGWGADARRSDDLWRRSTLEVVGNRARWRPADVHELVAARVMLVVPDSRPVFFDTAELYDSAFADFGTGAVPVHLELGAGGVVLAWGRVGSKRLGPLSGATLEVEGRTVQLGPFGVAEVQFELGRRLEPWAVTLEPFADSKGEDDARVESRGAPDVVMLEVSAP